MLAGTDIEENKYYRYITPVSKKTEITSEIGWRIRDVFGNQTYSIEVQLENTTLIVFLCTYDEKKYLIIDSLAPLVLDDMQECTSSLLTALGMITKIAITVFYIIVC